MNRSSQSYGLKLRTFRERRGITLESVAAATKINRSLLEELERGNPVHWPHGIYRRAFIRAYAATVGLPIEETVREFQRLFPENGARPDDDDRPTPVPPAAPASLRLTMAAPASSSPTARERLRDAAIGVALVAAAGSAAGLGFGVDVLTSIGVAALVWFPAAFVLFGSCAPRSLSARLRVHLPSARPALRLIDGHRRAIAAVRTRAEALAHDVRRLASR